MVMCLLLATPSSYLFFHYKKLQIASVKTTVNIIVTCTQCNVLCTHMIVDIATIIENFKVFPFDNCC